MSDIVFDRMLFDYLEKKNDQGHIIAAMDNEIALLRVEIAHLKATEAEREAVLGAVKPRCNLCKWWQRLSLLAQSVWVNAIGIHHKSFRRMQAVYGRTRQKTNGVVSLHSVEVTHDERRATSHDER